MQAACKPKIDYDKLNDLWLLATSSPCSWKGYDVTFFHWLAGILEPYKTGTLQIFTKRGI